MNYKDKRPNIVSNKTSSFYAPIQTDKVTYAYGEYIPSETDNLFHFIIKDQNFRQRILRPYLRVLPGPRIIPVLHEEWRSQMPCYVHPYTQVTPWLLNTNANPIPKPVEHVNPYYMTPKGQYGVLQPKGVVKSLRPYFPHQGVTILSACQKLQKNYEILTKEN